MAKLSRLFPVIYSGKLEETKAFYCQLLGFRVEFDGDWFVNLTGGANGELEIGIQRYDHAFPGLLGSTQRCQPTLPF